MVAAGMAFFGVRVVIRLPLRLTEEGRDQGLWKAPGLWLSQAGGEISLAALTALVFSRLGFLPFLLSDLYLMQMYGALLPVTFVVALLADVLLIPAMAQVGWVRFKVPEPEPEPVAA